MAANNRSSGINGVVWCKSHQRWMARIWKDRKQIYLGRYVDKHDAARARQLWEERHGAA